MPSFMSLGLIVVEKVPTGGGGCMIEVFESLSFVSQVACSNRLSLLADDWRQQSC